MKTFITVYLKNKEQVNIGLLKDFFKGVIGNNIKIEEKDNTYSFVFDVFEDMPYADEIASIINYELLISAKLFWAPNFEDLNLLNEYLEMVSRFNFNEEAKLSFSERDLVIKNIGDKELIKKAILKKYYNTDTENVIKEYLNCDMNISKASSILFMHRNTVMNKIDKFIEETGYDIKKFQDAFIIYHLL